MIQMCNVHKLRRKLPAGHSWHLTSLTSEASTNVPLEQGPSLSFPKLLANPVLLKADRTTDGQINLETSM